MKITKGLPDEVFVCRQHGILIRVAELIDELNATDDLDLAWVETEKVAALCGNDSVGDVLSTAG
jgi:hypothetical protein